MLDIREELSKNFIDFAAEANSQRAFPSAADGSGFGPLFL